MALTLTVDRAAFLAHVDGVAAAVGEGLVPVVKGNGYGFGRAALASFAANHLGAPEIAVGTVHELRDVPSPQRRLVLTPASAREVALTGPDDVLTVGHPRHVEALTTRRGPDAVMVKLASSMQRYGAGPADLTDLLDAVAAVGRTVHGLAIHPPLVGTVADHVREIEDWLPRLPEGASVYVSHLDGTTFGALRARHPHRAWHLRLGTALWHGDKAFVHLTADVVQVRTLRAGDAAGYRGGPMPSGGSLVMVSAGTAHGIAPLPDGRSPFHFARRRLALLEPPHMHTSMLVVPAAEPCPEPGDLVDVQRPLTHVVPDTYVGWPC
jgi:alanine racemase